MPGMKYLIFAGNHDECEPFISGNKIKLQNWRFLSSRRDLLGTTGWILVKLGTYCDREDYFEIANEIGMRINAGMLEELPCLGS